MKAQSITYTYKDIEFKFLPFTPERVESLPLPGGWPYSIVFRLDGNLFSYKMHISLDALQDNESITHICECALGWGEGYLKKHKKQ